MAKRTFSYFPIVFLLFSATLILSGCRRQDSQGGLFPVKFQTDWYPQPEHGGFYTALVKGYYKEEGLDVTILPGGPYLVGEQQVATGATQFAMGSSDRLLEAVANDEPLIAVGATLQHDPQAIMVHAESPVRSLEELDGHSIALKAGATYFTYLVKRYQWKNVREIPATYSISNFLQDPGYIQQIFVTSEPFYAQKAGAQVRTFLISDSGYDPYRVFFTSTGFLKEHPEVVAKFVRASIRGWREYMRDPGPANAAIAKLNPSLTPEQMSFTFQALKDGGFVTGPDKSGSQIGQMDPARWTGMYRQLLQLQILKKPIEPTAAYTIQFLSGTK